MFPPASGRGIARHRLILNHQEPAHFLGVVLRGEVRGSERSDPPKDKIELQGRLFGTKLNESRPAGLFPAPYHFFVVAMRADPKPNHRVALHDPQCPVVIGDPGGPESLDFLELNRCVTRIIQPEPVLFFRGLLNIPREEVVTSPKGTCSPTLHQEEREMSCPHGIRKPPLVQGDPTARP